MDTKILSEELVDRIIEIALEEDAGRGDITSEALIPCDLQGKAFMLIKEKGVVAGLGVAEKTFHKVDQSIKSQILMRDGDKVNPGDVIMRVSGNLRSLLKAERVALNFIQRLSGIATNTAAYIARVQDLGWTLPIHEKLLRD
jgi:nicotinate-nucleotide pyrophosphorylase (carboxylating)